MLKRIRSKVNKINKNKTQEHLVTNQADQNCPGKPGATPWITEFLVYFFEHQDTHRKDKVKQLIEKVENHPNKESILQDFKQTKEINEFSKESQELIADMNNTEIFELCENSSKQQRPDCNAYWEMGILSCSCGRNKKSSWIP